MLLLAFALAAVVARPAADRESIERALGSDRVVLLPNATVVINSEIRLPPGVRNLEIRGGPNTLLRAGDRFQGRAILVASSPVNLRLTSLAVDGNRTALERREGLPPSDIPFVRFTRNNGVLVEDANGLEISRARMSAVAGFAVIVARSRQVRVEAVEITDSGSRNAKGRNNATGGILLEEGTREFRVKGCVLRQIRGNGVWTHSLYTSPRNSNGEVDGNRFETIGRDAIQIGHGVNIRVHHNTGSAIGYPIDLVDVEGRAVPVGIDTAGNTERCAYTENRIAEVNGKCMDLDGFHDGEIRANTCVNRQPPERYPFGNYGIVMNNSNPDMRSEAIRITDNTIEGMLFGGIFVIGRNHVVRDNRLLWLNTAHCNQNAARFGCYYAAGEPDMLASGIYLGRGAERPDPAQNNDIAGNEITGWGMAAKCVVAAPGLPRAANRVEGNRCRDVR